MSVKKVPQRMCVACGQMKDKKSLIRVVCDVNGCISADMTGKAAGRGAYLCRSAECIKTARKNRRLDKALKHMIPDELWSYLEGSV